MPHTTDTHLIQRARARDLEAFNALVERYQVQVYNLCLRMLGQREPAEDATQETFLAAFQAIHRFRGGNLRPWLLRIAANLCLDELRRRKARPSLSLEAPPPSLHRPLDIPTTRGAPEEAALRQELASFLGQALATLPPDQRLALLLCDVHGLNYHEIAAITGTSLGTVKSRISRGRARLRHLLLAQRELLPSRFRPNK